MGYLDKNQSVFQRDEKGELIPQEVGLDLLEDGEKQLVKITPLTRGELLKFRNLNNTTIEDETKLIFEHCKEPQFTEEEISNMKPVIANNILIAILALSMDLTQKQIADTTIKNAIEVNEDVLRGK